jgi:serine/threonine-protein kinase
VDRYILCEPIAVGGMATVYFARQRGAAGFSKAVAIKRMRPDLVHEREFVDLFVDEARLASRVRHANVVSVTDVVASGDELLLVMEYLHGESLARLFAAANRERRRVPPAIAVALISNVLHGLHAAHEAKGETGEPLGIVHRDVSPQNVIVGVDGIARVADFGIARAAGQIHATDEGKTRGKAGYSAPEQLRGGKVTRQIDLWAACALLWEVLVGRRLFEGESQAAVVAAVLTEPIEPPGLHVPELPEELDDVILRGLDRDPKRRPETALELATALERALLPAGPAVVGAWVKELAREDLEKRELTVRRIEAGLAEEPPEASPATAAADAAGTGSLATSRSPTIEPTASSRSRGLVIGAAAAVIAVVVGALASTAARGTRAPEASASSAPAREAPPSASAIVAAQPEPSASTVPLIASAPPPSAPASVRLLRTPPRGAHPAAPSTTKKPKKACEPYDIDSAGRKIFRAECLE